MISAVGNLQLSVVKLQLPAVPSPQFFSNQDAAVSNEHHHHVRLLFGWQKRNLYKSWDFPNVQLYTKYAVLIWKCEVVAENLCSRKWPTIWLEVHAWSVTQCYFFHSNTFFCCIIHYRCQFQLWGLRAIGYSMEICTRDVNKTPAVKTKTKTAHRTK